MQDLLHEGIVEPPQTLGTLGLETWFITKFTALADPTLDSFLGLMGEDNRRKLAETFFRPTSWQDYCTLVSNSSCTIPDTFAQRAPQTTVEQEQFFADGLYTGHFRATGDNDCDANPTNCTGHVADFPCGWNSYMLPQIYYMDIGLKSTGPEGPAGGYPYERLVEMWRAANATKSHLMMQYWSPEPLYQEFLGTDAEFIRVTMPPRSQECLDQRRPQADMCHANETLRIGAEAGICEESAKPLYKVIVGNLYDQIYDVAIPAPIRSAGYDVLQLFQISELQLGQIFDFRRTEATPRDAVCRWVYENVDYLQTFVPRSYPRTFRKNDKSASEPLVYVSTIFGGITTIVVIITGIMVYRHRELRAIRVAQVEFLYLLLSGSLTIGLGAIVVGLPPSNASCVTVIWLINLGYTFELVPLIVKVAAVNKLLGAARQFRRVVLSRQSLFGAVFGISAVVVVVLLLWTILDPPQRNQEYSLSSETTSPKGYVDSHTIIDVAYYCSSESMVWDYIAVGWNGLLLLCAMVLAFQTRTMQKDFNESQTLAFLIYSHFVFVVLRLITLILSSSNKSTLGGWRSLIFSFDTMATIVIYFVPKFLQSNVSQQSTSNSNFMSNLSFPNTNLLNAALGTEHRKKTEESVHMNPTREEIVSNSMSSPEPSRTPQVSTEQSIGQGTSHTALPEDVPLVAVNDENEGSLASANV